MNGVLFRRSARSLWKTWDGFCGRAFAVCVHDHSHVRPKLNATLDEIVTAMPQLMNMVGMQAGSSSLGGFLINYLYGFLLLLLPLVFSILAANRLVARWVDTGSMAYLLVSPNTRARVARTQALVLIAGGTLLTAYCTALAVGCAAAMFPGELDVPAYLVVNAGCCACIWRWAGSAFRLLPVQREPPFRGAGRGCSRAVFPHPHAGQHGRPAGKIEIRHRVHPV